MNNCEGQQVSDNVLYASEKSPLGSKQLEHRTLVYGRCAMCQVRLFTCVISSSSYQPNEIDPIVAHEAITAGRS